jgi:hypothetical protein
MIARNPLGSIEKAIYLRLKGYYPTMKVFSYMPSINEGMPFVIIGDRFFRPSILQETDVTICTFELLIYSRDTSMEVVDGIVTQVQAALVEMLDKTDDFENSMTTYESVIHWLIGIQKFSA